MTDLIAEAFAIMVTGMVTVFVFLTLLIGAMRLLRMVADTPITSPDTTVAAHAGPTAKQLAAITAAIHQHRRTTSKNNK